MSFHPVFTYRGKEDKVCVELLRQNFKVYNPVIRVDKRNANGCKLDYKAMYPGWIFVWVEIGVDDPHPIRSTKWVLNVELCGPRRAAILGEVISELKSREDNTGIHQIGQIDYEKGDEIIIDDGLQRFEGIFNARKSGDRVKFLAEYMGSVRQFETHSRNISPKACV